MSSFIFNDKVSNAIRSVGSILLMVALIILLIILFLNRPDLADNNSQKTTESNKENSTSYEVDVVDLFIVEQYLNGNK